MKKLNFEFIVDKKNNTITVEREFAANRQLVWDCYTKSELLDQWFSPKPLSTKTKSMDFKEGGHWVYAMVEPNGTEYWGRMDYLQINPIDFYRALDGFCDSEGKLNPEMPRSEWEVNFKNFEENTLVETLIKYNSLEDLETVVKMGVEEGMISTLEHLDELLLRLKK